MKLFVNGLEWAPGDGTGAEVSRQSDRLVVRTKDGTATALVVRSGGSTHVSYKGRTYRVERAIRRRSGAHGESNGEARAPMPGQIVEVTAKVGDVVEAGTRLMVLEAMKMQQPITAPVSGNVKAVSVVVGAQVAEGDCLVVVEQSGADET
jgi:3-methylcrotonyl-CoA carboxylase alpha subunit